MLSMGEKAQWRIEERWVRRGGIASHRRPFCQMRCESYETVTFEHARASPRKFSASVSLIQHGDVVHVHFFPPQLVAVIEI